LALIVHWLYISNLVLHDTEVGGVVTFFLFMVRAQTQMLTTPNPTAFSAWSEKKNQNMCNIMKPSLACLTIPFLQDSTHSLLARITLVGVQHFTQVRHNAEKTGRHDWKVRARGSNCGKNWWSAILIRESADEASDGGRSTCGYKKKFDNLNSNASHQKSDSIKHFCEALTASTSHGFKSTLMLGFISHNSWAIGRFVGERWDFTFLSRAIQSCALLQIQTHFCQWRAKEGNGGRSAALPADSRTVREKVWVPGPGPSWTAWPIGVVNSIYLVS
jgi:hypothetical protein